MNRRPATPSFQEIVQHYLHWAEVSGRLAEKAIYPSPKRVCLGLFDCEPQDCWSSWVIDCDVAAVEMDTCIIVPVAGCSHLTGAEKAEKPRQIASLCLGCIPGHPIWL